MNGKAIMEGNKPSVPRDLDRNLAITSGDLPQHQASSSSPPVDATSGDGVAEMMGNLRLTSHEAEAFVLEDEGDDDLGCPEWALSGKVLAPNTYHISTIKAALRPAWGNPKGLEIRHTGRNTFMAEFATKADKARVTEGHPWTVGNHAVLLNDFDPSLKPSDVRYEKLGIWIHILNLPFSLMNDHRGKDLAGRVGKVEKMDVDEKGKAWGEFLRFRATVNITEPFMRCFSVYSQKRQATEFFSVMYERLPTFCLSCGLLGHSSTGCPTPAERDADGLLPYHGPRLCVPDDRKKKTAGTQSSQGSYPSDQGSRHSMGKGGPKVQTKDGSANNQKEKDGTGEVASPVKPKLRQRKPRATAGAAAGVVQGNSSCVSGQKRKEYRPRASVLQKADAVDVPATEVPARALILASTVATATVDGPKYTWNNRQCEEDHVKVRLDRAVANGDFTARFDDCSVENIITTVSDHLAILINLSTLNQRDRATPVQYGFRFEAAWLRDPDYKEVLEKAWTEKSDGDISLQSTWSTLHQVAGSLQSWSRETFGAIRQKIRKMERKLHHLRLATSNEGVDEIRKIEKDLCELFDREEVMARQRSRVEWLRAGDHNTAFFHARATARKRANKIKVLQRQDGSKCDDASELKSIG
ncbi:hypothetical protein ACQ4PT_038765 [Festuca glaucescens]